MNFKKSILLTGAGFTANFGGFLASDMWYKILNHPELEKFPRVKNLFVHDDKYDFELIYSKILNDPFYNEDEKNGLQKIVRDRYVDMDNILKFYTFTASNPSSVNLHQLGELFYSFRGGTNEMGAVFTLNQDLFLERNNEFEPLGLATLKYKFYLEQIHTRQIDPNGIVQLPSQEFLDDFKKNHLSSAGDFTYIKLHGSLGWYSSLNVDRMVLGDNKEQKIQSEPILNWYFELFKEAICRPEVKLLIIGYGFRDNHINEILLKGMKDYGLKVYIVSPGSYSDFKQKVSSEFLLGLSGYFPHTLNQIFPSDQSRTDKFNDLLKVFPKS